MKERYMKQTTDTQKLTALTQLLNAAGELIHRGGASKTWKLITEFKAKKALRCILGRAPEAAEVSRLLGVIKIKPVTGNGNGHEKAAKSKPAAKANPARNVSVRVPKATAPETAPVKRVRKVVAAAHVAPASPTATAAATPTPTPTA